MQSRRIQGDGQGQRLTFDRFWCDEGGENGSHLHIRRASSGLTLGPVLNSIGIRTMDMLASIRIDKTVFSVASLADESDEKRYWLSKTPHERLEALELMRQAIYGYDQKRDRYGFVAILASETVLTIL